MRNLLISLLLCAGGCGSITGLSAREKCREAGAEDAEIDLIVNVVDAGRDEGISYLDAVEAVFATATSQDEFDCLIAIIDGVYGR